MNIDLQYRDQIPDGFFDKGPLPVVRVLYEAEQPIVYITKTRHGQEMLAYLASETATHQFTVVAPTTAGSIERLQSGSIGVREALIGTWMWLARASFVDCSLEVWPIAESDIPEGHLPRSATPLLPAQQIAFSLRAVGDHIALGCVPCSVVSFVAEAARSSLKAIFDHAMSAKMEGRPSDAQRALYDLPVQQLRFASFEVCLAAPKEDLFPNDSIAQALQRLEKGLVWAQHADDESDLSVDEPGEVEAILRATLALTPPMSGQIRSIEVGGAWLHGKRYRLTRDSRSKVSGRLRNLQTERIVVYAGRIGEIDDDKLSFTLRDVEGESEYRGSFPEHMLDDMRTHYYEANRIEISGVVRNGKLRVTAVVSLADAAGDQSADVE